MSPLFAAHPSPKRNQTSSVHAECFSIETPIQCGGRVEVKWERKRAILEVANLECVRGDRRLFRDINFSIAPGTLLQVTGPNGSGKTSLLRIVSGLMTPENGEIRWQDANIKSLGEDYFRSITYIGHRNGVKEELSSLENLRIASGLAGVAVTPEKAKLALEQVGLRGREHLPTRFLSEGQKRRSALARLLTSDTTLWVLDEVLASLDHAAAVLIESVIGEHLSKGGLAIVATHHELHISTSAFQRLELGSAVRSDQAPLEGRS